MTMDYSRLTDREVLLLVAQRTERLDHAVHGNGRPGLLDRMAVMEADYEAHKEEVYEDIEHIRNAIPGQKERWGMVGTVILAALSLIGRAVGLPA